MQTEMTDGANPSARQDESAVAAVRSGDAERYRELVERHERRVYAVAWSRLGDAALAEEVTQEAFIRAYRRLWLLGDGAKFAGWVNTIARRVAINFGLRHRRELNKRKRWALENPDRSIEANPADETDPLYTPETLRQTLAELPAAHRECLVLFYLEGKSGADAASALGISEAALRVRLHRARAAMRERLEEKLEGSLAKLGPGKTLVPAIMASVLAASSAKAATLGGGGAAFLGTLAKLAPFKWLLPFIAICVGALPSLALTALAARAEQRNYRDPEDFRAKATRAMYRTILWVVPLMVIPMVLGIMALRSRVGEHQTHVILAVVLVGIFAFQWSTQRNPFQRGLLVWPAIVTGGIVLTATGLVPPIANAYFFIAAGLWQMWMLRKRPTRVDNSLFLRAMLGILPAQPTDAPVTHPEPQLGKSDLMRFGRFLGDRWLVNDFRWRPVGLLLRQRFIKPPWPANKTTLLKVALQFSPRDSSNVLLRWAGEVTAHFSEADERTQRVVKSEEAALRAKIETQVAAAVAQAWRAFRDGNIAEAERVLGEKPDSEIFAVPPARAASTRWLQVMLAVPVVMFAAMLVLAQYPQILKPFFNRHKQWITFSETDVRVTLLQLGKDGGISSNALRQLDRNLSQVEVLPAKTLFSSNAWAVVRKHLLKQRFSAGGTAAQRVDRLLGSPDLLRAVANGWLGPEDFGLTPEEVRRSILDASDAARRQWFAPQEVPAVNPDHMPADYTTLNAEELTRRVQCLKRFGCLDADDGSAAIEVLLKHQVLSEQLPAGRRKLPFPKLLHGTFLTVGSNPIQDTYHALVVLESFGALDRVDREACIGGILRFDHGNGLFKSIQRDDGLVTFWGYSHTTLWAFESLRILGALDRVKDLDCWQFRPRFVTKKTNALQAEERMTWSEIEAWVCKHRLEEILRERKENPQSPACSLLEP